MITESELLQVCLSKFLFPELPITEELEVAIKENYLKIIESFDEKETNDSNYGIG